MRTELIALVGVVGSWAGGIITLMIDRFVLPFATARFAGHRRSSSPSPPPSTNLPCELAALLKENNELQRHRIVLLEEAKTRSELQSLQAEINALRIVDALYRIAALRASGHAEDGALSSSVSGTG